MVALRIVALGILALLGACASDPPPAPPAAEVQYHLGPGDKLTVTVFGNSDISGTYTVDTEGRLDLPLMGTIAVGGKTVAEAREAIRARLDHDLLVNPKVMIEVANYRPFFILGEVNHPGNYPYSAELTVSQSVAVAGGFTRRARSDSFLVTRRMGDHVMTYTLSANDPVLPGDTIEVRRRSF